MKDCILRRKESNVDQFVIKNKEAKNQEKKCKEFKEGKHSLYKIKVQTLMKG